MSASISAADAKLLASFCDPEWLASRSPGARAVLESAQEIKDAYRSISYAGKYTKIGGWDEKGFTQHVARITPEQRQAILMLDPEILTDRRKFYYWLEHISPTCDVRGKIMGYS